MSLIDSNVVHPAGIGLNNIYRPMVGIPVDVIFGAPGKDCLGAGICRIFYVEHVRVQWRCPSAGAFLELISGGSVQLTFDRKRLSAPMFEKYFSGQMFRVEEAYPFTKALLSRLNLVSFTVKAGQYPIQKSPDYLTIIFK
jgi:hypothetical protein